MHTLRCLVSVLADSSGPSSAVSSAGPSSPTTADTSPRFSFSEKVPLTPQSSEETHSSQNISTQPPPAGGPPALDLTCPAVSNPGEVPLAPKDPPEGDAGLSAESENQTDTPELPLYGLEVASVTMDPSSGPVSDADHRPPCMALAELGLGRMEGYGIPSSLPVLLELRESSSEAGSSSQTPQSPEGPDEFFDTQESMDLWMDGPENTPLPETTAGYEAIQPADP